MERFRVILAIILITLIWFIYFQVIMPKYVVRHKTAPEKANLVNQKSSRENKNDYLFAGTNEIFASNVVNEQQIKYISNDAMSIGVDVKSGSLTSIKLKKYMNATNKSEIELIQAVNNRNLDIIVVPANNIEYAQNVENLWQVIHYDNKSILMQKKLGNFVIGRKLEFNEKISAYSFHLEIVVTNQSDREEEFILKILGLGSISSEDLRNIQSDIFINYSLEEAMGKYKVFRNLQPPKNLGENYQPSTIKITSDQVFSWVALTNNYFVMALLNSENYKDIVEKLEFYDLGTTGKNQNDQKRLYNYVMNTKPLKLMSGESKIFTFTGYAGPKKEKELEKFSSFHFDEIVYYGIFGFIAKPLLLLLMLFKSIFGNYGVAIIIVTLLIRIVLFPLTQKSQASMYMMQSKMQKLQAKFNYIREKYKDDKQKQSAEIMKLYKEHGVNPLAAKGCLTMLIQIPIFCGLYQVLTTTIELRQAPFALWITDLSQPDRFINLGFSLLGDNYLHLLPIAMVMVWLIQSLTAPSSPDPQARAQQKFMAFLPLVFGLLFYNFASGLNLYWFVSNLLGIVEQSLIKKKVRKMQIASSS